MKDVKLKERLENAFEVFFENVETNSTQLEKIHNDEIAKESAQKTKAKNLFKIIRQVFFFLPGTFVTFFLWMDMMALGSIPHLSLFFMLVLLLPPFLIVLGMGNIKNLKHWVMPLNVIILGAFLGFVLSSVPALKSFFTGNGKVMILFPLALITAVLSKNLADNLSESNSL